MVGCHSPITAENPAIGRAQKWSPHYGRGAWLGCPGHKGDWIIFPSPPLTGEELGVMPAPDAIRDLGIRRAGSPPGADPPTLQSGESVQVPSPATGATTPSSLPATSKKAVPPPLQQPFVLSDSLALVPPKLVAKIQRLEFVDMAELLRDNLEAQRRVAGEQSSSQAGQSRSRRREIPDLLSWVSCFGTYMAVLTSKYPEMIKQLLAYQTLMVREARRCGGNGWLAYDTYFRQQVAEDPTADWSRLNTALYAVTFMAQGAKGGQNCTTCMETDYTQDDCAVSSLRSRSPTPAKRALASPASDPYPPQRGKRRLGNTTCFAWN